MHGAKRPGPKGRCFVYGGQVVRGLGELAAAAGLPLTTVRIHAEAARDHNLDLKPLLDSVRGSREAKKADPEVGDDGRSIRMLYAGRAFSSKKDLARDFAARHDLKWRSVQKELWHAEPWEDQQSRLDAWLRNRRMLEACSKIGSAFDIPSERLVERARRGLDPLQEAIKISKGAEPRQSGARRPSINWRTTTFAEAYEEWGDQTRSRLPALIVRDAFAFYPKGDDNVRVGGLVCAIHGPIDGDFAPAKIKTGRQPCDRCAKRTGPKIQIAKNVERLRDLIRAAGYPIDASAANLVDAGSLGRRGSDRYIKGLACAVCGATFAPIAWSTVVRSGASCQKCLPALREAEARRRLAEVHGTDVELIEYHGSLSGSSRFRCTLCSREDWRNSVNALIGNRSQLPARCSRCFGVGTSENAVAGLLKLAGLDPERQYPVRHPEFTKALRCDFYIRSRDMVIEYDGPAHFFQGTRRRHHPGWAEVELVRKRDRAKVEALRAQGIEVCRIPYWADVKKELALILSGSPTYRGEPPPCRIPTLDEGASKARRSS